MRKKDIVFGLQHSFPALILFIGLMLIRDLVVHGTVSHDLMSELPILTVVAIIVTLMFAFLHHRANKE
ncbi:MAG: hypothetical protein RR313_07235 [Anaerovoracaceae bacterium]